MAGRRINNACEESRESRAALVRMKYLGAILRGSSKPRTSKRSTASEGCAIASRDV